MLNMVKPDKKKHQSVSLFEAKMWTSAMSMYRQLEQWEDAKRVAKVQPVFPRSYRRGCGSIDRSRAWILKITFKCLEIDPRQLGDVSINEGTLKWMVFEGESHLIFF